MNTALTLVRHRVASRGIIVRTIPATLSTHSTCTRCSLSSSSLPSSLLVANHRCFTVSVSESSVTGTPAASAVPTSEHPDASPLAAPSKKHRSWFQRMITRAADAVNSFVDYFELESVYKCQAAAMILTEQALQHGALPATAEELAKREAGKVVAAALAKRSQNNPRSADEVFSLPVDPRLGYSSFMILQMWLVHNILITRRHEAEDAQQEKIIYNMQMIHRLSQEYWWSLLTNKLTKTVGAMMIGKHMRSIQTSTVNMFQALDAIANDRHLIAQPDQFQLQIQSILYRHLYSFEPDPTRYALEIQTLAKYVIESIQRMRAETTPEMLMKGGTRWLPIPELREEDRAEAEKTLVILPYKPVSGGLILNSSSS